MRKVARKVLERLDIEIPERKLRLQNTDGFSPFPHATTRAVAGEPVQMLSGGRSPGRGDLLERAPHHGQPTGALGLP